jgi:hypothetical protein
MATNSGKGSRKGSVTKRTQFVNPTTGVATKRNTDTGQFMGNKSGPYKGVAKETDKRRS